MKNAEINAIFAPDALTVNGKTFPAQYSISPVGTPEAVYAFLTVQEDGQPVNLKVKIPADDPQYSAALAAAQAEREAHKRAKEAAAAAEAPEVAEALPEQQPGYEEWSEPATAENAPDEAGIPSDDVNAYLPEEKSPATEAPHGEPDEPQERDPKHARGPVPEKTFVGSTLTGKGWEIRFDGERERTRVIFQGEPPKAALVTVEKAGFFWSPAMGSFNKKLTFKAFRAAQALALDLRAVCG